MDDVFSRLQAAGVWVDDSDGSDEVDGEPQDLWDEEAGSYQSVTENAIDHVVETEPEELTVGEGTKSATTTSGEETDIDDIDSYMKNLLARNRGEVDTAPRSVQGPPPTEETNTDRDEPTASEPEPDAPPDVMTEDEYRPRSSAPELATDLVAMRELANSSAHSAITTFTRRNHAERGNAKIKIAGALGGLGACSIVFISRFQPMLGVGLGAAALIGAVMMAAAALGNAAKLRNKK
jgi:hypothetical protein